MRKKLTGKDIKRGLMLLFLDFHWILLFFSCLFGLVTFMTGHHKTTMLIFLIALFLFWFWRTLSYSWAKKSLNWISTEARIVRILQMRHYSKYGQGTPYLNVVYSYTVKGKEYTREFYTCFPWTSERKISTLAYYQQLRTMTVYYNPRHPGQVVEKTGIHDKFFNPGWVAGSLFLLVFVGLYWGFLL